MDATFYDGQGRITGHVCATDPETFRLNVEGQNYVSGIFDHDEYFISAGIPILRPAIEVQRTGENGLTGLPVPCTVEIDGQTYEVDDGEFFFDSPLAGEYPIRVTAFPFLPWEGVISVESAESSR